MRRVLVVTLTLGVAFLLLGAARGSAAGLPSRPAVVSPQPIDVAPEEAAVCSRLALAGGTSFRATLAAERDSYVYSNAPTTNYGTSTTLRAGVVSILGGTATYRTLVRFDLSSLPADAVILTATLELYQTQSAGFNIKAQALTGNWSETDVAWNNQSNSAEADEVVEGTAEGSWKRWNLTPIATKWYAGTLPNHGVRLVLSGIGFTGSRVFNSREGANPPRLVVEYVRRTTIPVETDAMVDEARPSAKFGTFAEIKVGRNATTLNQIHALLGFNTSGVPAGSTVVSASLGLQTYFSTIMSPTAPQAVNMVPEAILAAWAEGAVTFGNAPHSESQGDPAQPYAGSPWSWLDVTGIARAWVSGALDNYGIKIKPELSSTGIATFYAREGYYPAQLIVTYGPPPCYPATGAAISGATAGLRGSDYAFNVSTVPSSPTPPIVYTWEATGQTPVSGPTPAMTYTWTTTGSKTITVTVASCDTSVVDTHQVTINEPPPACPSPITGLSLGGPATGFVDSTLTYSATPSPANATTPINYTWQAAGQPPTTGPQAAYTWSMPGTKAITVTAQNCGGTVVQHTTVAVQMRPDLVISGAWYNAAEARLTYILKNTGGGTAPAGHMTALYRDAVSVASAPYAEALPAGATRAGGIPFSWSCEGGTAQMKVCADTGSTVPEDSETNNCFEEVWSCDLLPPQITSGPTVSSISEDAAIVTWTTNEPARSRLDYGRNSALNLLSVTDDTLRTSHQATLSSLESGSVYWHKVYVTDAAGNLANSDNLYFETRPVGTDPVVIAQYGLMAYAPSPFEFFVLYADVNEPAGVDRVTFFLDGLLIGRDYSPTGSRFEVTVSPAALGMSRAEWYRVHTLQVQAYNLEDEVTPAVKQVAPVSRKMTANAVIVSPGAGAENLIGSTTAPAGTTLDVMAYGAQYTWACTESGYSAVGDVPPGLQAVDCGDVRERAQMKLYLDEIEVGTATPPIGSYHHTFSVNLAGKGLGTHTLRLVTTTGDGATATAEKQIVLVQGQPELSMERSASRSGSFFVVTLTLRNTGTVPAAVDTIDDFVRGFQVVEKETATYVLSGSDSGLLPSRRFRIDFGNSANGAYTLGVGATLSVQTTLVPFLDDASGLLLNGYYIGSGATPTDNAVVTYRPAGAAGPSTRAFSVGPGLIGGVTIDQAVRDAVAAADYILVTSPVGLWTYTDDIAWRTPDTDQRELSLVLSRMAELATLRNGVLGFLPAAPDAAALDKLLEPGGLWADALHPNFRGTNATGYVLFVGEDEIIPPQEAGYEVPYSDLRYASTSGKARPELVLGRIVGSDLGTLSHGLKNAIDVAKTGVGFDRQRALLTNGRGEGETTFYEDIIEFRTQLNHDTRSLLRWTYKADPAAMRSDFSDLVDNGQSFILYRGHAGATAWGDSAPWEMGTAYVDSLNLDGYHPVVYALACQSGNYRDSYSMAEAWLRRGAGVYIGAVSNSYRHSNTYGGRAFLNRWGRTTTREVGEVFTDMARDHWFDDWYWKRWIYQYHLFGDPKFGALPSLNVSAASVVADGPIGSAIVAIPEVVVTAGEDGWDRVTIPGGSTWFSPTEYAVPTWKVTYTYPQGRRVRDVRLTAQAGLTVTTGLNIPISTLAIDSLPEEASAAPATPAAADGWLPHFEQPYVWHSSANPDGTSTLEIIIYPFTYNPVTTDARFYREWSFDVDVLDTTVDIVSLNPTQAVYGIMEPIVATLIVNNSGAAQPVLVQSVVRSLSDEVSVAVPLQAMHAMTGTAVIDLSVPPIAAGSYTLDVELVDMEGYVLDTASAEFSVGVTAGVVTALKATPPLLKPGDHIGISMTFRNTGDVALNGVAVIRVAPRDGIGPTAEFSHTLTSLAPGAPATFNDVWDSTGASGEAYRVVGYVKYGLGVSLPVEVALTTRAYVYLPLALRQ